ncbi:MAG TPA: GGDEF domain-containing protein [Noviherbaspirillum sp.]|nr:GGDEF domain-containing protein [Noviherbaspirillum sp.]
MAVSFVRPLLRKILPLNLGDEMGHACFRLTLVSAFSLYLVLAYFTGHISEFRNAAFGVAAFFSFAFVWIGVVHLSLLTFRSRRVLSIMLDQAVFAFAAYHAGEVMAPVMWGPVLMAIGNGLRNGPRFAKLSSLMGALCTGTALWFSPNWNLVPLVCEGIIASILILPWYTVVLAEQVEQAKRAMQARAAIFESASRTDSLTELLNRSGFFLALQNALDQVRGKGTRSAVMLIDLDGFKAVNDACGHAAGDEALREVALRLRSCFRSSDKIARIGGDEFGIVLSDVSNNDSVERLAQKAIESVAEVCIPGRPDLRLGASIGICALSREGGCGDCRSVMDVADRLMYQAKRAGKNQFRIASAYAGQRTAAVAHA